MKQVFLFTLITISGLVSAQPYESIFGSTSTMWIIKWSNLDFGGIDTLVVEKDTMAHGFSWKKIISTQPSFWSVGLLREDTLIGKVWYRPLYPGSDTTHLAFDYALQTGDTFDLSSDYALWLTSVIVDSTYTTCTVKSITFGTYIEESKKITFIEGVGGNQGPIYKETHGLLHPYLLCAYKDGIQTYANISYNGNCSPPTGINQAELAIEILFYPNPVYNTLYIKNLSEIIFTRVEVYDYFGRNIYSANYQPDINFHDLMPGLYYVRLITDKGQIFTRSVFRQ